MSEFFKAKGDGLLDLIFYFLSPRNSSWWVNKCLKYFGKNSDFPEDVRMLGHCAIRRDRNKNLAATYQSSFFSVVFFAVRNIGYKDFLKLFCFVVLQDGNLFREVDQVGIIWLLLQASSNNLAPWSYKYSSLRHKNYSLKNPT